VLVFSVAVLAGAGYVFRGDLYHLWQGYVTVPATTELLSSTDSAVASFSVRIVRKIAHDPKHFVQGLQIVGDSLYEGTGLYGKSELIRYRFNREAGALNPIWRKALAADEFGEGIAMLGDVLYQLTWKEGRVHRYREKGQSVEDLPALANDREGWGLTTDGRSLIASDGSDTLLFRSAEDFSAEREVRVHHRGKPVVHLNELEFIDGKIWANVWKTQYIVVIDPASGAVTAIVDCAALVDDARAASPKIGFLNGIAWDKASRELYLTGKLWPWIYQVRLDARL
tara:strand:- start:308 stop:1156 length:849 start_codon:yes stop_codon:yes gene_type:complete